MDYESFVAYSSIAIVVFVTVSFLRWVEKSGRESRKRREEFERRHKAIEAAIRQQKGMAERAEVEERPCSLSNDDFDRVINGIRVARHQKPKKGKAPKPEWWRFLTEESIGSLLEKRRQKKAEAEARKNDPWSSL